MASWFLCFICAYLGLRFLFGDLGIFRSAFGQGRERAGLERVIQLIQELQETLEAGLVPASERWSALKGLSEPWGSLCFQSIDELRGAGASVLPTLKRLRNLAAEHLASLAQARAKSSQALTQAAACALLVPVFGSTLYLLLPGIADRPWLWLSACALGLISALLGACWLFSMSDQARWGGLSRADRPWVLAAQCAGERFLALIRGGMPADLAWTRACELLESRAPALASYWGHSIWESRMARPLGTTAGLIVGAGSSLKKAVQVSLLEGRPCTERAEAALEALRNDLRAQVDRELTVLGVRALKPLFVCVAPALLGMLFFGLYLGWAQATAGGWG